MLFMKIKPKMISKKLLMITFQILISIYGKINLIIVLNMSYYFTISQLKEKAMFLKTLKTI